MPHRKFTVLTDEIEKGSIRRHLAFKEQIWVSEKVLAMPEMAIVLEEDKAHAYRGIYKLEKIFFVTLLLGAVAISVITFFFSNHTSGPILLLSKAARRVAASGDYTISVPVDRADEIGTLSKDFNTMVRSMGASLEEIKSLNREIESTQREVVFTMGAIGESRSKETGNHVRRVAEYSKVLALHYGLPPAEGEMLKQASPMHDIGKIAIPDAILNKPARFNEEERAVMQTHAFLGYEMLRHTQRPLLQCAAIVAYEHHEKWDGTGYPRRLAGEDIHIYGRITAVADVFDALGSDRVYKKAWDDDLIFAFFREERGRHFDPKLVDIFFDHLDDFLAIRERFGDEL